MKKNMICKAACLTLIPCLMIAIIYACCSRSRAAVTGNVNAGVLEDWMTSVPETMITESVNGGLTTVDSLSSTGSALLNTDLLAVKTTVTGLDGMSYLSAVTHGYIEETTCNSQLTGTVKASLESQLQHTINDAVDAFYIVQNSVLGLPTDCQYLYCASTGEAFLLTVAGF